MDSGARDSVPLVCAVFPEPYDGNPYQSLLHDALERRGANVVAPGSPTPGWAIRGEGVQAVHFHWLENLIRSQRGRRVARATALFTAGRAVRRWRPSRSARSGGPDLWTVHNLRPHEPRNRWIETASFWAFARVSHVLILHSSIAAERFQRTYGRAGRCA